MSLALRRTVHRRVVLYLGHISRGSSRAPGVGPAGTPALPALSTAPGWWPIRRAGTGLDQHCHIGRRCQDVFEIVEHQQQRFATQVLEKGFMYRSVWSGRPAPVCVQSWKARSGSPSGARARKITPSGKSSIRAGATSSAIRVFPTPPGPVRVTRRAPPRRRIRQFSQFAPPPHNGHQRDRQRRNRPTGSR